MFGLIKKEDLNAVGLSEKQLEDIVVSVAGQVVELMKREREDSISHIRKMESSNASRHEEVTSKIVEVDKKIEGEYVTPQDVKALKFAVEKRATFILQKQGVQLSLDTFADSLGLSMQEQADAHKKAQEQFNNDLGKVKAKIMVSVKKYLGMKGNSPNNHIKRKDVDMAIDYISYIKPRDVM